MIKIKNIMFKSEKQILNELKEVLNIKIEKDKYFKSEKQIYNELKELLKKQK